MDQHGVIKSNLFIISIIFLFGCSNTPVVKKSNKSNSEFNLVIPKFNPDSAYSYIRQQVDFGPRVPNTSAHLACYSYLISSFNRFGANVITQMDDVKRYDGVIMNMKNIIASFNPNAYKRILLCAHWDTRFLADNDSIDIETPILGANDGGSGVGVLLEIARQLHLNPIELFY